MKKNKLSVGIQLIAAIAMLFPFQLNVENVLAQEDASAETLEEITPENVQELELLRWIGQGAYRGYLAQQADGDLLAAGTSAGVALLDKANGAQVGFIPIGLEPTALSISPDGTTLAVVVNLPTGELGGSMIHQFRFYSLPEGEEKSDAIQDLGECGGSNIWGGIAFTPDGSELVFEREHGGGETEKKFCVLSLEEGVKRTKVVSQDATMAVSPKGDYVAAVDKQDDKVSIYATADFSLVAELETSQTGYPYELSFSSNGRYVGLSMLYDENKDFQVWNLEDGQLIFSGSPSTEEDLVTSFDVDANGDTVFLGTQSGYVEIISTNTGKMEKQLGPFTWEGHALVMNLGGETSSVQASMIKSVMLSQDGRSLILSEDLNTYGQSGDIHIFQLPEGEEAFTFNGPSLGGESLEIAFSPDSRRIAMVGSADGKVEVFGTQDGQLLMELNGHSQVANKAAFSPDGKLIATCSDDNTIRLWDVQTGDSMGTLTGHQGRVNRIAFSPDSTWLVSGADDNTIRRWDVADGKLLETLELGNENWRVEFLDVMNDNASVVYRISKYPSPYIGYIQKQELWDTENGETKPIGGSDLFITNLSNGKDLFLGYGYSQYAGGRVVGTLQADGSMMVTSVFSSPYGNGALAQPDISLNKKLVICGNGFGMHAWELSGNNMNFIGLVATEEPAPSYGMEYLFSPDGKYVAYTDGGVAYLMGVKEK